MHKLYIFLLIIRRLSNVDYCVNKPATKLLRSPAQIQSCIQSFFKKTLTIIRIEGT